KKTDDLFGIVDGQQRLTTITMILCALRDFYISESFDNSARGVHKLIEKVDLDNKSSFILQTETSYPYFQEYIQKYDDPDTDVEYGQEEFNLKNGFEQISKYIKGEIDLIKSDNQIAIGKHKQHIQDKLNEIRDRALKLKVIYIELDDEDDAYVIFETLNTRGKDLSVGDLVKNYLTKNIKAKNAIVDIPKDKWNTIRSNIDSTAKELEIDTFLLHVWLSKFEYTTAKTLFKKLKKTIRPNQAKAFLDSLVVDSVTYKNIFDTDTKKWGKNEWPLKNSLKTLYSFNVTQQTPMVLSVMREYSLKKLKYKYAKEILDSIEHFHFIFTAITSQRSSGGVATMYSTYARKLSNAPDDVSRLAVIRELRQKMREKIPTFEEFLAAFRTLKFTSGYTKQKRIIHYALSKFDSHYNSNGASVNYEMMTLEHILAQNPSTRASNHDAYVGQIGNLILVDQKTNNALGTKAFSEKKIVLQATNIHLDKTILDAVEWTQKEIDDRTHDIATKAFNIVFEI
ncbi:MAG TPA: DUF262 domain-containing protein, partial [Bacteroidia bacterium]|nr:DUF262 domain-containing protein [Bacteroidia bacterium]